MKRKRILTMLLAASLSSSVTHAQFPDIPPGHYAENAVDRLTDLGVISGFPDGFFRGQATVNRFELSLILTRMWDTWSKAQLSDVFSQHSELMVALEGLRQQQSLLQTELEAVGALEARLALNEDAITQLDARTEDTDEARRVLTTLQQDLASLRQGVLQAQRQSGARARDTARDLSSLSPRLNALQKQITHDRQVLTERDDKLALRLKEQQRTLDELFRQGDSWNAELTLAAGVDGESADYLVGMRLESPSGEADVELYAFGPEVKAEGFITPGITALGRYHSTDFGTQGAFGLRFSLPSQLSVSVLGAHDGELVAGAQLEHDGQEPGSALPGVTVRVGALTNVAGEAAIGSNLLVQGVAGVTFGSDAFSVTPSAFYRRQAGSTEVQLYGSEVRLDSTSEALSISGAARYGVASDASQSVGAPEGDVRVELASGGFASVNLSGGLPPLGEAVSFADASPLAAEQLVLGAKVGITFSLDDLLK